VNPENRDAIAGVPHQTKTEYMATLRAGEQSESGRVPQARRIKKDRVP